MRRVLFIAWAAVMVACAGQLVAWENAQAHGRRHHGYHHRRHSRTHRVHHHLALVKAHGTAQVIAPDPAPEENNWAEWEEECRTEAPASVCAAERSEGEEEEKEWEVLPPWSPAEESNINHCTEVALDQGLSTWACDPKTGELLDV